MPETTNKPSKEGWYVIRKDGERSIAVVAAKPRDFSESGGMREFYEIVIYSGIKDSVEIGQRVDIQPDGPVLESFPAQAKAKSVKVLPAYKPDNADVHEAEVVRIALQTTEDSPQWPAITNVSYDEETDMWQVGIQLGKEKYTVDVPDELEEKS